MQVNPHVWGSAIAQAASLQFIAALPMAHHSLFAPEPMLEYARSSHPFRQQLITRPLQFVDGCVDAGHRAQTRNASSSERPMPPRPRTPTSRTPGRAT